MGGERASSTRQREAGKICCFCSRLLDAPPWPGERSCARCDAERPRHRVLMNFVLQKAWHVSFLESDSRTRLWRTLTFNDSAKIFEMATRGGAKFTSEDRSMFEYGMQNGRGAVWLNLTEDQYRRLK